MKIRTLDIEVPGKVVRRYDQDRDVTTFEINSTQLAAIDDEIAEVRGLLPTAEPEPAESDPEPARSTSTK